MHYWMLAYLLNVSMLIVVYWLVIMKLSLIKFFSFLVHFYDPVVEFSQNRIELDKRVDYGPYQPVALFLRINIGGKIEAFMKFTIHNLNG